MCNRFNLSPEKNRYHSCMYRKPQTFTQKLSGGELMGNLFASSILDHNLSLIKDNGIVQIRKKNE